MKSRKTSTTENVVGVVQPRLVRPLLFRQHCGVLDESMQTVREMPTQKDLEEFIHQHYGEGIVTVAPYTWDSRIGWDTHIVCLDGNACGFTNGNFKTNDEARDGGLKPSDSTESETRRSLR